MTMMSAIAVHSRFCCNLQRSSSLFVQKRYSTRESIHRYVEPDKFKKHLLAASEPYFKKKYILQSDSCHGTYKKVHDLEPLQRIYADELLKAVEENDFVLFIQHNYTPFQSERLYKNKLIKSGGQFWSHRNVVYKDVFANLGIEKAEHLFNSRNSLVLGKYDCLSNCVKALRTMPQFILLAGYMEKELFSYDELQLFSNNFNLDLNRATLTGILETPAIELYQNLKQYVEMHPEESKSEKVVELEEGITPGEGNEPDREK